MNKREIKKNLACGAAAGAAGTALMQGMMAGSKRFVPETLPPIREDPGDFMVKQAERLLPENIREKVPEKMESFVARGLAWNYGITFGLLFALIRPRARNVLVDGAVLGAATWAVGSLGWLPATKLTPPVWKQSAKQVVPGVLSHIVFGVATVAAFKWARQKC